MEELHWDGDGGRGVFETMSEVVSYWQDMLSGDNDLIMQLTAAKPSCVTRAGMMTVIVVLMG